MKHIYILLFLAVVYSVHVSAQVQTAESSSADSLINVVAYFCKNDTMDFRIEEAKHKIRGNDTTLCRYSSEDFRLIVRDSTSNGYKLEYISLGNRELEGEELGFLTKPLLEKVAELSDRQKVIFTIDEVGNLQHIENWREIKKTMQESIKIMCDSLYGNQPMLDSIMPRNRFEMSMNLRFATEESIWNAYEELQLLFCVHGKAFTIGQKEVKDDSGYPSVTNTIVSYGSYNEEDAIDGDYFIEGKTTQTIPSEDLVTLVNGQLSGLLSDEAVNKMKEANLEKQFEDAQMIVLEAYYLFFNGWPCDMTKSTIIDVNGYKNITTSHIQWLSRRWQPSDDGDTDEGKTL